MELTELAGRMTPVEFLGILVGLLVCLSVASERLVEIIKGIIPFLEQENKSEKKEGLRKAFLQALAVCSGIVTALLARPALVDILPTAWTKLPAIFALGFLASGGSGLWNGILTYIKFVKDIKEENVNKLKKSG